MHGKVLIVSYTFPPTGGAGVQRVSKFVKYLREFGWEPVVLTASNPSVPLTDQSLLADIPDGVAVYRARTYEPSYALKKSAGSGRRSVKGMVLGPVGKAAKQLLLPDAQVLWWPELAKTIKGLLEGGDISCIFVTSPPYSALVPAVFYAKRYGVPVVLDFRDEWSFSRSQWENSNKSVLATAADRFLERYVLKNCSRFTAATQSYVDSILHRHPYLQKGQGEAITNGYDDDDLVAAEAGDPGRISFVYTGTVWNATSLRPLMAALSSLVEESPELLERITLKVIGRVVEAEQDAFACAAGPCVKLLGYIDHDQVMRELARADVLILSLNDLPGAERIIPGKLFEYMATGKHILALVPEGETRRLVREKYPNSTLPDLRDREDIRRRLASTIKGISGIRAQRLSPVTEYSRRHLTRQLSSVLLSAVADGSPAGS